VGLLDRLSKQFTGKSDADLDSEVVRLAEARRAFFREHSNTKDDGHAQVDRFIADQLAQVEALFSMTDERSVLDPQAVTALRETWPLRDPKFAQRLHKSVDEAGGEWSSLSRAAIDEKLATFDAKIADIRTELERRRIASEKEAAEAELAALESKTK
jgi:DNA-binding transcriptional regulator YiaG